MGKYHPIFMKFGTQTKKNMLSSRIIKAEAYGKKQQKSNVINDIVLRKQRGMSAKLYKSKIFLFAGRSFHTHTTCG
jgi:hypothetical protein